MLKTGNLVIALQAVGVPTPPRPVPPFEQVPCNPTPEDIRADQDYQQQCLDWIAEIKLLHLRHFPPNG